MFVYFDGQKLFVHKGRFYNIHERTFLDGGGESTGGGGESTVGWGEYRLKINKIKLLGSKM